MERKKYPVEQKLKIVFGIMEVQKTAAKSA
jgi:hypothetical protein